MQRSWHRWVTIIVLFACLCPLMLRASAEEAGWSTSFDPRKRVFLSFRSVEDGPRTLLLACLRDVDMFTLASEGVAEASSIGDKATLTLINGEFCYTADGGVSPDPDTGTPSFSSDIDLDADTVRQLRNGLLPVLEGKGPIQLAIGPVHRDLPVSGLAEALKRFKSVCFGIR
jgi:hypothetical protein